MVEKENQMAFESVKIDILKKVSDMGPMGEMRSWKMAFPEIDFVDSTHADLVDEALFEMNSGLHEMVDVNWEGRTVMERTFFVSFVKNPLDIEVRYDVIFDDELVLTQTLNDPQIIWYMWLDGCFSGEDFQEEQLRDFVGLVTSKNKEIGDYVDDLDLDQIRVEKLKVKVAPI